MRAIVLLALLLCAGAGHGLALRIGSPPRVGTLELATEPSGASIYVDDVLMVDEDGIPVRTPLRIYDLPFEAMSQLRVVQDGFRPSLRWIRPSSEMFVVALER